MTLSLQRNIIVVNGIDEQLPYSKRGCVFIFCLSHSDSVTISIEIFITRKKMISLNCLAVYI